MSDTHSNNIDRFLIFPDVNEDPPVLFLRSHLPTVTGNESETFREFRVELMDYESLIPSLLFFESTSTLAWMTKVKEISVATDLKHGLSSYVDIYSRLLYPHVRHSGERDNENAMPVSNYFLLYTKCLLCRQAKMMSGLA